jgi:putative endonuclease
MQKQYFVYIITNQWNNVFYTGVTNNLIKRLFQHKEKLANGFSKRYNVKKLVHYEIFNNINDALVREKQIKSGSRQKKIELIKSMNYNWENLNKEICN